MEIGVNEIKQNGHVVLPRFLSITPSDQLIETPVLKCGIM